MGVLFEITVCRCKAPTCKNLHKIRTGLNIVLELYERWKRLCHHSVNAYSDSFVNGVRNYSYQLETLFSYRQQLVDKFVHKIRQSVMLHGNEVLLVGYAVLTELLSHSISSGYVFQLFECSVCKGARRGAG